MRSLATAPPPSDRPDNPRLGIALMITTSLIFAVQDGISRHLAEQYNVMTVVMLRYWFFAAFVIVLSASRAGGIARVARTQQMGLQIFRGVLLAAEICVTVLAFVVLGLIETHVIFAIYPLLVAALSGPVLGEAVGWRRWSAIGVGFVGVVIILRPGLRVFSPEAFVPLVASFMFALYALMTRKVGRRDEAETSFFYTGVAGAVAITLVAPFWWTPMRGAADWGWMLALCIMGATGHYLLIKAYEFAEAGTVQPFSYFQLAFVAILGLTLFGETIDGWTLGGTALILAAGVYTMFRQAQRTNT